ncbi:ferredoxin [Nakamurella silvestris]|nr:ferredoxin [Nakamurella silvestris]
MKFTVDMKKCQDHGQCVYSAPTLFALDDLGKLTFREETDGLYESEEVDESLRDDLEEAADVCPMQAIEVLD